MTQSDYKTGILAAIFAYILWGVLPLYWKLLEPVSAAEVLAHRIIWSLLFMLLILTWKRQLRVGLAELKRIFSNWKPAIGMILASCFISLNWFVFIWAVSHDRVIEASLGYYINPLLNVILSFLFLKERFTRYQMYAVGFAFIGVTIMTSYYGVVPWVAFVLALSFGIYGLMKKLVQVGAMVGLTIETLLMTPFALIFIIWLYRQPTYSQAFTIEDLTMSRLLIGAGAVTAIPLLLFAISARRISLSLIGFLQYIGPTIMLLLGIFLYNEPFSLVQFISFIFIWIGLLIFTTSKTALFTRLFHKPKINSHKKKAQRLS
ncbi:EamA family transporter RarD [Halalkalibacter sp. APA_J-10(15)]|uniref:EamA family transporter RarD n=1 Tax=Halalkalibacter sp. APA_J-10(15) TaxID=2933805 RepID=UPI001FF19229|nr:EamA family transporter RarD [Halalkalibacter sp. APA_J-10(15)]MCK0469976.1 EamA family transporter RarD [Halalkalibacter sp. APA_J-10(15)]